MNARHALSPYPRTAGLAMVWAWCLLCGLVPAQAQQGPDGAKVQRKAQADVQQRQRPEPAVKGEPALAQKAKIVAPVSPVLPGAAAMHPKVGAVPAVVDKGKLAMPERDGSPLQSPAELPGNRQQARPATTPGPRPSAWVLPAMPAAAITTQLAVAPSVPPGTAAFTEIRRTQAAEVLQRHGFAGDLKDDAKYGLPKVILADPVRVQAVLGDLRTLGPPLSNQTVFQRRLPETHDSETATALTELRNRGALDNITAVAMLTNESARLQAQQRCVRAATALDGHEANVRTIGTAEPGAYAGSPAFWEAVERLNAPATAAYREAAGLYASACLDTQGQSLTPAQRKDMQTVVGFLHIDGVAECMGTRIAPDRFLTARHCLYRFDRNIGWERQPVRSVQVALAGKAGELFAAEELDCATPQPDPHCSALNAANPLAADHLVLRLKPSSPGASLPPMRALRVDQAARQQMLVVPGRSAWITGRALRAGDPVYVTTADIGGCMVTTNQNGCLVNSCQSEPGFSGAPMFARRQVDELVLVGIFLGSTSQNAYQQCQWPNRNFGAPLPRQVVTTLK